MYCSVEEAWSRIVEFVTYVSFRNSLFFHLRFGKEAVVHAREGILLPRGSLVDHDRTVTSVDRSVPVLAAPASLCVANLNFVHGRTHEEVQARLATDAH